MKRLFTFIIDMILTLIILLGSLTYGGYWAYKNVSLETFGVNNQTVLGDLSGWTIEEWANYVTTVVGDPSTLTLNKLKEEGFNTEALIQMLGIDEENVNADDLASFKNLPLTALFTGSFDAIELGVVFLFLPKDVNTGAYPIFSEGAREYLRDYKLSDLMMPDENGIPGALTVLGPLKIGSILSDKFTEIEDGEGGYTYSSEDRGINLIANIKVEDITSSLTSPENPLDIGYELHEGFLSHIGEKELREIVASFGSTDEETYQEKYELFKILGSTTVQDIFKYNDGAGIYEFQISAILEGITLNNILGYELCSEDEYCPVHQDVADCDGDIYSGGSSAGMQGIERDLFRNLLGLSVSDFNGLDMNVLVEGVYLGSAFGYEKATPPQNSDYCQVECEVDEEGHKHKYYFADANGDFVGEMYNKIANFSFTDALNGEIDISSVIDGTTIGEVMGYTYENGEWVDKNGNPAPNETVVDKILLGFYDKNITGLTGIEFDDLMEGIKLGELLNLKYCSADEDCVVHEGCDKTTPYWCDKNGNETTSINNSLAGILITDLINNPSTIQGVLEDLQIGEVMGYKKEGDVWLDKDGNSIANETAMDKILNGLYDETVTSISNIKIDKLMDGITLGDLLSLKYCTANEDCVVHENCDKTAPYWCDKDGKETSSLNNALAGVLVSDLINDSSTIQGVLEDLQIGEVMGYKKEGDVWLDKDGKPIANETAIDKILSGLYDETVTSISSIKFDKLMDGITFGELLELKYCAGENKCTLELEGHGEDCVNKAGKWLDKNGKETSSINSAMADVLVTTLMNDSNAIHEQLKDLTIGEVMGYKKSGDVWVDKDNVAVNDDSAVGKILSSMYDKTIDNVGNVEFSELMKGVTLGELLELKYCSANENCEIHENCDKTVAYWYNKNGTTKASAINNALASVLITDLINDSTILQTKINALQIGEVLGYEKKGEVWYDGETAVPSETVEEKILLKMYDRTVENIIEIDFSDLMDDITFGEILGLTYCPGDNTCTLHENCATGEEYWYKDKDTKTTALNNALSNISITELINDNSVLQTVLDDLKIGEVLGYEKKGDVWYDGETVVPSNTIEDKILLKMYDRSVANIGGIDFSELMDDITFGEILGLTYCPGDNTCTLHENCSTGDKYWYKDKDTKTTALNNALADILITDLINDNGVIQTVLDKLKIGEVLGYELIGGVWCDDGVPLANVSVEDKILHRMYDRTVANVHDIHFDEMMEDITFGELLGLTYCPGDSTCTLHENCNTGEPYWHTDKDHHASAINNALAPHKITEFVNSGDSHVIQDMLESLKIGEVMGYKKVNGEWVDENDDAVPQESTIDKILLGMYDSSITSVHNLTIENLMAGVKLGELLDLKYCSADENCELHENCDKTTPYWYDDDNQKTSTLNNAMAGLKVTDLMVDGNAIQKSLYPLYVGEVMTGYVFDNGIWKKKAGNELVELSDVEKLVVELKFEEIFEGNINFDDKIDGIKLSSLIDAGDNKILQFLCGDGTTVSQIPTRIESLTVKDVVDVENNNMLSLLKDSNVKDLATDLNKLYMGEIMNYVKCSGDSNCAVHGSSCDLVEANRKWFKCSNIDHGKSTENSHAFSELGGITAKVAGLTVKELGEGKFQNIIDDLRLGDVFDNVDEGIFSIIDLSRDVDGEGSPIYTSRAQIPVDGLAQRIFEDTKKAKCSKLMELGIISFTQETQNKLDLAFNLNPLSPIDEWRNLTVNELLDAMISLIP